jgi:hypothetical protein
MDEGCGPDLPACGRSMQWTWDMGNRRALPRRSRFTIASRMAAPGAPCSGLRADVGVTRIGTRQGRDPCQDKGKRRARQGLPHHRGLMKRLPFP